MSKCCASCTYLDPCTADSYGRYYCEKKGDRYYGDDPSCGSYCEAYSRSSSAIDNMIDNSRTHRNSGCYITTIMCNILGFDNNNYYLNTLRKFRNDYLQKNKKYLPILVNYDKIGPKIAYCLSNSEYSEEMATLLFNYYIEKAVSAIEYEKYEEAVRIYYDMTRYLMEYYGINSNINKCSVALANPSKSGHGYYVRKEVKIKTLTCTGYRKKYR